ncbi:putative elongation factor 2 kinase [Fragilariopsis cylindrus CCMP1102]|uniref:Putative elongation factor 2 kinase n=1 Tax=Fragilariopsis cylindrus CCMP1102 TaxID=635003 RepID=A0A1E7F349_9STRA|nr:putative elongation factor 2 kinase [Fragilariopsis cylindrus CCMP1102]|eukprot:OEU12600.1 putative elongation factor 2 kinase [Fragilariopsis cylindrus CCMP1102]
MPRNCSSCNRGLSKDCFSKNQWSKGIGYSRCHACINPGSKKVDASQTARTNNATHATFTSHALDNPFAEGSFRWVAKGVYDRGNRTGEPCVCKWFKTGGVLEAHFYDTDLSTVKEALRIITKWNSNNFVDKIVKINQPAVWTFENDGRQDFAGKKVLQEPFIKAIKILCDLQGGVYQDGVVLTDPVVCSIPRTYGPTDLGLQGMNSFFANHTCNEFCRSNWKTIRNPLRCHSASKGTTMEHVPTRRSRPHMSMGNIYE